MSEEIANRRSHFVGAHCAIPADLKSALCDVTPALGATPTRVLSKLHDRSQSQIVVCIGFDLESRRAGMAVAAAEVTGPAPEVPKSFRLEAVLAGVVAVISAAVAVKAHLLIDLKVG